MNDLITVGELSRLTGLSTHAIRFYEAKGVLRPANRAPNGHRRYNQADVQWLEFVLRLKSTGMPLAEIRDYAEQRAAGDISLVTRMHMLEQHQDRLTTRIAELAACAQLLDEKMRTYRKAILAQQRKAAK
ncbi:MAG TPA: MerR family transcriptional regulator [Rhodocyclaceae bacterium]|nr:MerR family transcriptional regulator [Rhodocyclaceae bacterium]